MASRTAILVICTLTLFGCKKDNPVGPNDGVPVLPSSTAIIGAAGGTLATDGFVLTIPQGAFSRAETLLVATDTYDSTFGSRVVTGTFRLEGLPLDFAKPLTLRLKSTQSPLSDCIVAMGSKVSDVYTGCEAIGYRPLIATVDSGYLAATIPTGGTPNPGKRTGMSHRTSADRLERLVTGIDRARIVTSRLGHFILMYPVALESRIGVVSEALESAYYAFRQYGFDTDSQEFKSLFPVAVVVGLPPFEARAQFGSVYLGPVKHPGVVYMPTNDLIINEYVLTTSDDNSLIMGAGELFALLLCTVRDPVFTGFPLKSALEDEADRIWPYYSIAAMMGELLTRNPTTESYPLRFRACQSHLFSGVGLVSSEKVIDHGVGFSALACYLCRTGSNTLSSAMFEKVRDVSYGADAILGSVTTPVRELWPAFLQEYITGNVYSAKSEHFLNSASGIQGGTFTIAGKSDTLRTFSGSYADLSARLFLVNLEYPGIDTSARIMFSVGPLSLNSQHVGVMLFGLKDNTLTYWQYANTVSVTKIKDLTTAGYDIVAAVVNCLAATGYGGSRAIDLTISVETPKTRQAIAYIDARVAGTATYGSGGNVYSLPSSWVGGSGWRQGTIDMGKFSATWNSSGTGGTDVGQLTIQLFGSAPPSSVVSFSFKRTTQSSGATESWELSSIADAGISAISENGEYVYRITGAGVTSLIAAIANRNDASNGTWREFSNPVSDGDNSIEIKVVVGQ